MFSVDHKGGMTGVPNERTDLVPMRPFTRWGVCMDYQKLNAWTEKDHFLMLFKERMLHRLVGKGWLFFLMFIRATIKLSIAPEAQDKTTFTCPHGTFTFKRMSFWFCNAPATFQICMMSIFVGMVEETIEVFMDYF